MRWFDQSSNCLNRRVDSSIKISNLPYLTPCFPSYCSLFHGLFSLNPFLKAKIGGKSTVELPLTATFLADSPYIDSYLNLSTTASFFCSQGGRCGEVQLYCYLISPYFSSLTPHPFVFRPRFPAFTSPCPSSLYSLYLYLCNDYTFYIHTFSIKKVTFA